MNGWQWDGDTEEYWKEVDGEEQVLKELPEGCGPVGVIALADGIKNNGALTSLNVSNNALCGLDKYRRGTYDVSGVTALADAIVKHE